MGILNSVDNIPLGFSAGAEASPLPDSLCRSPKPVVLPPREEGCGGWAGGEGGSEAKGACQHKQA